MVKGYLRLMTLVAIAGPAGLADASDGREEFEKAARYFQAEEYEAALPFFQQAYERSNRRPAAVFALAQCERALKMYEPAIAHFREYLRSDPANAADVQQTIVLLEDLLAQKRAADRAEAERQAREEARQAEARKAEQARLAAEARRRDEAKARARREMEARDKAEQELRRLPAPPPPPPAIVATAPEPSPADDDGTVFERWWFWVIVGSAVAGGAVTAGVLLSQSSPAEPYGGTTGVVLRP